MEIEYLPLENFLRHKGESRCLIDLIGEPNASSARILLKENIELIYKTKGSTHNHQAWEGGYVDHIMDAMNIAKLLYKPLSEVERKLPFELKDALLALFLHDIEKPWRQLDGKKYGLVDEEGIKTEEGTDKFRRKIIDKYFFDVSPEVWNAIKYAEGEKGEYSPNKRNAGPLAAFVHSCDILSARLWFNYPNRILGESWGSKFVTHISLD